VSKHPLTNEEQRLSHVINMSSKKRRAASRNGLGVPEEEVLSDLAALRKSTTNVANQKAQLAKVHLFKAYFYATNARDLLLAAEGAEGAAGAEPILWTAEAREAFRALKKNDQKKVTARFNINYAAFNVPAPANATPMEVYLKFLLTRRRGSVKGDKDVPLAFKSLASYNTAFFNGMLRSGQEASEAFKRARRGQMADLRQNEQRLRGEGMIKAHVGSDVFPLHLHDYLCERLFKSGRPQDIKLLLVMLLAFRSVSVNKSLQVSTQQHDPGCPFLFLGMSCMHVFNVATHVILIVFTLCSCTWRINKVFAIQLRHFSWFQDALRIWLFSSKSDPTGVNQHQVHLCVFTVKSTSL
jgi:hypothetical protein